MTPIHDGAGGHSGETAVGGDERTASVLSSLDIGGPLFQLWRRRRRTANALELTRRRIVLLALVAWLPLLLLSMPGGAAWGNAVDLTFLGDIETHVKLLLAMPLLIVAEVKVQARLRRIVALFLERGLIDARDRPRFEEALASSVRLRNSVVAELALIVFVYAIGVFVVWRTYSTIEVSSWYASPGDDARLTPAGWWAACVSLPMFQFLLLRWYFRLLVWGRFLWQVSRIELKLMPAHPDSAGGLSFLSMNTHAYATVMLAQGTALSGWLSNRIFYDGANLLEFKAELIGTVALMVLALLAPLLFFYPQLREARRQGKEALGTLGQRYVRDFELKWLRRDPPPAEPLIGSADIQSLADLRNSYLVVSDMSVVPFTTKSLVELAAVTLLPVAPLLLTTFSAEQLVERVLKTIF